MKSTREGSLAEAKRWLAEAEREPGEGGYDFAAAKGYNALELAVKAALALKGLTSVRTHSGRIREFGKHYVKKGEFPSDVAKKFGECLSVRAKALYEVGEHEAETVVEVARATVKWLEERLAPL